MKSQHKFPEDAVLPLIWQRAVWNDLIFSSCAAVKLKARRWKGAAVEHIKERRRWLLRPESRPKRLISADFPPPPDQTGLYKP